MHLKLSFVGANPPPRLEPLDRLETKASYPIGADAAKWRPDVLVWGGVRYLDLAAAGGRVTPRPVVCDVGARLSTAPVLSCPHGVAGKMTVGRISSRGVHGVRSERRGQGSRAPWPAHFEHGLGEVAGGVVELAEAGDLAHVVGAGDDAGYNRQAVTVEKPWGCVAAALPA